VCNKGGKKMSENKTVFVSEENYKMIVEKLGYKPSNLVVNKFLPDTNHAIVVDNKQVKAPVFNGFYLKI
jgi:hypothetical protein